MEPARTELEAAFAEAAASYIVKCRARVEPFCKRHFGLSGAARLNRKALGRDLLRTPANVAWAVPYLLSRGGTALSRKLGFKRMAYHMGRVPPGFKTDVEREVEWLIYRELLQLPFEQSTRRCTQDALFEEILAHPKISLLLLPLLVQLDQLANHTNLRQKLETHLRTYTASRTAAAEVSGALLNLAAGAAAFQKLTPGALAMGTTTATAIAQYLAVSKFALGPTLGTLYYGVFPATASMGLLATTTGGLMLALGVLTACAGVIIDPVQQALGMHERKLNKLVATLEFELAGQRGSLRIRDMYVARVFDLWDLLQTASRVVM